MYIDFVIVLSLVIVALTCLFLGFITCYAYKHIKADIAKTEASKITS